MTVPPPRVRYAPSPTGFLHIGGLRTALYNWLFARRHGGTFILRLEDTDRERFVEGAIENLSRSLAVCGVGPDEGVVLRGGQVSEVGEYGPYIQSQRIERHNGYAQELIANDRAYYCFCPAERLDEVASRQKAAKQPVMYDRHCRNIPAAEAAQRAATEAHVIRLKVPTTGSIVMEDVIRGRVEIPWGQIDDQVLIKSDGFPTYHLAATCDDHDMAITHVIRGEEWLPSLPKHLYIMDSLGWTPPQYAHLPLLLNSDRSKLSKRQGDVAVEDYLRQGYLPAALVNFVALLGWNPSADQEMYTPEELAAKFDLAKVNRSGAVVNFEKLDWLNAQYLRALPESDLWRRLREGGYAEDTPLARRVASVAKDRLTKLADFRQALLDTTACEAYEPAQLVWKKSTLEKTKQCLAAVSTWLNGKPVAWFADVKTMETDTFAWIESQGWSKGDVLWPLRVALSGRTASPSPFEMMFVIGQAATGERVAAALDKFH